jgi:hypothetical protein
MMGTFPAWAQEFTWENVSNHQDQNVFLDPCVTTATDSVHQYGRGEYLAEGSVEIVNQGNGDIYIRSDTFSYVNADRILHHVFLESWDEDQEEWIQVAYWEFEEINTDGDLYVLTSAFTVRGCETGLYYRVRGLHGVEFNGELEACATRTAGILITDN